MNSSVDPTHPVPVAIIGMGCLFPKAEDLSRYWANIRNRLDAITEVPATHWRPEDYFDGDPKAPDRTYARRGGFLDPADFPALEFGIAPNNLEATDTTQLLGLLVAREALKDAGYGSDRKFDRNRVSVILGVTGTLELVIPLGARLGHPIWRRALKNAGVPDNTAEEVVRGIADSYVSWQENSFPGLLGNVAAGRIANRLDLGGTNCVVDAACASSLGAVHLAVLELASRRSDMVLTGGLDTFNDIFMYMCFSKTPALSPTGNARPFDVSGDGTILGEGLGVLALKRLDDAQRDNDRIYAVIRSIGTSSDGKVGAVYAPSSDGQVKALKQAYELGNVSPSSIELLEAHGTGTKVGDAVELAALNQVYRGQAENEAGPTWCALGSVKSQIGHTKAAAGAAGLIKAALALHHKVLPPTAKVDQPVEAVAPGASPFYVNTEPRPWMPQPSHPRRAAVSAFGFGGSNFHCVLEEAEAQKQVIDWDGDVQILAFSADRPETLLRELKAFPDPGKLSWPQVRVEAGRSRGRFQANAPYRLTLVAEREGTSLASLLSQAVAAVERGTASNGKAASTPGKPAPIASGGEAIFFETEAPKGHLGFLFPGQGAQYAGMLRSLTCRFPQVHDALAEVNRTPLNDGRRLADLIYPHPAFNDADRDRQQSTLRATQVAQPALGALGLGMYRLLEHFGVQPDAVAGHSYGELTALCAAGRIDARTLDLLSRKRGELMAGDGQEQERGSMLAVAAPLEQVEAVIREAGLDLVVANKNAPRQAVLSGPSAEIEKATRCFDERKIVARRLPVSGAFHSRFVASASGPFLETLRNVPIGQGRIPVYSNTTATPYPAEADAARTLLAGQLAQPVEFVAEIEAMHQAGVRTFLEVGPDARLTGLVRAILEGRDHNALAVDASRGQRGALYDLASALARLSALGHTVELARWDDGVDLSDQSGRKPALTVKISGANLGPKPQAPAARASATPAPVSSASSSSTPSHSSLNGKASPTKEAPAPTARPRTVEPPTPHPAQAQAVPASGSAPRIVQSTPARPSSTHAGTPAPLERNGTHVDYPMNATNGSHPRTSPSPARATGQPIPSLRSSDPQLLTQALEKAQENLVALQKLSEQTSSLHRQFLDGQDKAQRSFQTLLEQQQKLTYASLGLVELAPIPSAYHPAPEPSRGHEHPPASPRFHAPAPSAATAPTTPTPAQVSSPAPAPMSHQPQARVQPAAPAPAVATPRPQPAPVAKSAPAPAPVSVPTPAARPLAPASPSADRGRIQGVLLAVVSEKTGYPAEMLEPDMLLDADLGIDSIKRVEILAAIQEQLPDAPVVKPEHLGTLRTLGHIVEFLAGPASTAVTNANVQANAQAQAPTANHAAQIQDVLLAVVSEKTGYPAEMLEPDMLLDADLGIDSIKRVEILAAIQEQLPDAPVVKPEHLGTLRTLGHIVEFLAGPAAAAVATTGAPATPSQPAQTPSANHAAQIQDVLLTVVSEKTGYPAEMLEPDMLLDADLGIDSIKRVEILAAIQEQLPDAPVVKPEHLGTLRTLGHIVEFLAGTEAEATGPPEPPTHLSPTTHINANGQAESPGPKGGDTSRLAVSRRLVKVEQVASPESRPSVKVRAGGEYWIAGEDQELASALASRLLEVGHHPRVVTYTEVAGLTAPAQLDGLILIGGRDQRDDEQAGSAVKSSFQLLRTCAPGLRETGRNTGAVLATVTRLGGSFGLLGLAPQTSARPTSGALAGLTKTASHEWPEVTCKAIDLDPAMTSPDEAASRVLEELFRQGPLEVGLGRQGEVNTLVLASEMLGSEFNPAASGLKPGDVVVISGGARGVTAEAAVALARAFQPTIVLLGRSPEPTHEPAWLAPLTDEAEIKRALVARANGHATPQLIGSQFRDLTASREILANLARIEAAGARAFYYSVDVRDQDAVQARIDAIRGNHGPIRGLVHGAGVLADRRIEDQSDEQFASVFDTKVAGLRALLDASANDDLRVLVLFSSSTARFGRTGQVAYAAANEVLNKWGQAEARRRPSCRVVSVNWGPWNGGMVTPSLRPLFESEGIPLIPLLDGANYLARELRDPAGPVEIVILGPDPENPDPENAGSTSKTTAPTAAQPTGSASVPIFERALDLASAPVLGSHVIDGRPVLPMALILEWLAQGALQRNPGLVFAGIDDLRLHKGVVLHNNERPETLGVHASKAVRDGSVYRVEVEIRGVTSQGRALSHAKGVVILADRHAPAEPAQEERPLPPLSVGVADLYRDVLFHGPELQGLERVEGCDESGISATAATAPAPSTWLDRPLRQAWVADPLALDCAFQLMIVWSVERSGVGSLPTFVGRYRQFRRAFPVGGVRIVARVTEAGTHRARADIEFLDLDGELVARIDDYECVIDSSLNQAFRRNQLTSIG